MRRFIQDSRMLMFIALPLLFSRLVDMAVFFVGFLLIAKLGHITFAASALASSVYVTSIVVAMGILYAMGIKMSQAFGAKDNAQIREYFYSAFALAAILAGVVMAMMTSISFFLPYFGQDPALVPTARQFMFVFCIPLFPTLVTVVVNQLVSVLLKPKIVYFTSIINAAVTILCFYPLMFGGFGIQAMGPVGFGLSLFIGNTVLILITLAYVKCSAYFKAFQLFHCAGVAKHFGRCMKEMIKLGLPMGIQFGAEIAACSVMTFLIGHLGVESLVAAQVAQQITVLVLCIPFTLSEATAILVGQSLGNEDAVAIRNYSFSSQKLVTLLLIITAGILCMFPKTLAGFYIDLNDPSMSQAINLTILFLYVAAVSQLFDALRNTISGALRGLNDSMYPMYVGIFIAWCIGLPLGSFLAYQQSMGPIGFPIGTGVGFCIGAVILAHRLNKKTQPDVCVLTTTETA